MDDLDRLVNDLGNITSKVHLGIVAATKISASRAEEQARQNASGRSHLPRYPSTITSEVEVSLTEIGAKVGPEKRGQGLLGHLVEHGSPTSQPHMDVHQAVDGEMDAYVAALAKVAGDLL